jgi:hypothetical protein
MSNPLTDELITDVACVLAVQLRKAMEEKHAVEIVKQGAEYWIEALERVDAGERCFFVVFDCGSQNVGVTAGTESEVIERLEGRRGYSLSLNLALSKARAIQRRTLH